MTYKSQQEKDSAIAALKQQLEEAEKATVSGRWKPKEGEDYFYIRGDRSINECQWVGNLYGEDCFSAFNVFATREEAQAEADKTLIWREFRAFCRERNGDEVVDWKDSSQNKWGIEAASGVLSVDCWHSQNVFLAGCAFVGPNAEANAHAALEKFGDRLHLLTTA